MRLLRLLGVVLAVAAKAQREAANMQEVELHEPADGITNATATASPTPTPTLPLCRGGCDGLSCAYPTMCKYMVSRHACECALCKDCAGAKAAAEIEVKEFFAPRKFVIGASRPSAAAGGADAKGGKEHFKPRKVGKRR
mmetsp:Transcript_10098/g.33360  ORF Transcript_10098/g.33360 Transcript_10098/m.33360 type:complete len:139 (-) Transcript_10098:42-458(-)